MRLPRLIAILVSTTLVSACQTTTTARQQGDADRPSATGCKSALDCPAGQGCRVAEGECDLCRVAGECRPGEACIDGVCGDCESALQCDGALCRDGDCTACIPGTDDAECATVYDDVEFACNADGRCSPLTCTSTAECQIPKLICSNEGRCVKCEDYGECVAEGYPAGTLCVDGLCKEAECLTDEDCETDEPICGLDSKCRTCQTGDECTAALGVAAVCEAASGRCYVGDCSVDGAPCGTPDADRVCVDHVCTGCSTNPQCVSVFGSGVLCIDGHCLAGNCADDLACDGGQRICGDNHYCRDCVFDSGDCGEGRVCSSGSCHTGDCAPSGNPCGEPIPDRICLDYICSDCTATPQCLSVFGAGFVCVGGACVGGDCLTSEDCDGGQQICDDNSCRSCVEGSAECGAGRVCGSDGRCHDGECWPHATGCCDADGALQPSTYRCSDTVVGTEYRCNNTDCGADAELRHSYQYCTGTSAVCDNTNVKWDESWTSNAVCGSDQVCGASPTASWCDTCDHGCNAGACYPNCNPSEPCCSTTGTTYGCFYDSASGIEWQEPPPAGGFLLNDGEVTTTDAREYCANLTLGGWTDWNVPSVSDLRSLVRGCAATVTSGTCDVTDGCFMSSCYVAADCNAGSPLTCNPMSGPGTGGCYWPSTLAGRSTCDRSGSDDFWSCIRKGTSGYEFYTVDFATGALQSGHMRMTAQPVRCRRGGICPAP